MLVLCDGMPRSASTWSFNVVMGLLRRSSPSGVIHGSYDEHSARFIEGAPSDADHLVLKCHSLDAVACALLNSGSAQAIFTHRDVHDAIVSTAWMFDLDFDAALGAIAASLDLFEFHVETSSALTVDYHDLVGDPGRCIQAIATYLELITDPGSIAEVADETSLERMAATARRLERSKSASLVRYGNMGFDPVTLLQPHHIRDSGASRPTFSKPQAAEVSKLVKRSAALRDAAPSPVTPGRPATGRDAGPRGRDGRGPRPVVRLA